MKLDALKTFSLPRLSMQVPARMAPSLEAPAESFTWSSNTSTQNYTINGFSLSGPDGEALQIRIPNEKNVYTAYYDPMAKDLVYHAETTTTCTPTPLWDFLISPKA